MDAVTAVSGSGPAYFALLAEAMIEAGILLGLSREISTQLVVQTMLGTAKQLRDLKMHPVELREMVTSPGRDDDRGDSRARAGRRARGVPERDPGGDGALEGARARRPGVTDVEIRVLDDPAAAAGGAPRGGGCRGREPGALGRIDGREGVRDRRSAPEAWRDVHVWFGDERAVPPDDERSNYRLVRESLLDRLESPPVVHRVQGEQARGSGGCSLRRRARGRRPRSRAERDRLGRAYGFALPWRRVARGDGATRGRRRGRPRAVRAAGDADAARLRGLRPARLPRYGRGQGGGVSTRLRSGTRRSHPGKPRPWPPHDRSPRPRSRVPAGRLSPRLAQAGSRGELSSADIPRRPARAWRTRTVSATGRSSRYASRVSNDSSTRSTAWT